MNTTTFLPTTTTADPYTTTTTLFPGNDTPWDANGTFGGGGGHHDGDDDDDDSWQLVTAIVSFTVLACGVAGNTLVMWVLLRHTHARAHSHSVTNIYILNLAAADLLYSFCPLFFTAQNLLKYWPLGELMCRLVMVTDVLSQFSSTFSLLVMSIDRYLAVVHPVRSQRVRRPRVARITNACVWLLAGLAVSPVGVFSRVGTDPEDSDQGSCNVVWPEPKALWDKIFIYYTASLGFLLPLVVICICYVLIVIKVRTARVKAGLAKRRRGSERSVTRMVCVIVCVFVLCWLPFFVANVVNLEYDLPEEDWVSGFFFFTVTLTYANSAANPLLYGFLSSTFRQGFRKALCCPVTGGGQVDDCPSPRPRSRVTAVTDASPRPSPLVDRGPKATRPSPLAERGPKTTALLSPQQQQQSRPDYNGHAHNTQLELVDIPTEELLAEEPIRS